MKRAIFFLLLALPGMSMLADARLPENVRPVHYDLRITVDLAGETFSGRETIDVEVREPVDSVTLHSIGLSVHDLSVEAGGRTQVAQLSEDPSSETIVLKLPETVSAGPAKIALSFEGKLGESLRGLYLSRSATRKYAVTQFESTAARRAFPCFDEPAMKATFDVTLVVDSRDTAISNEAIVSDEPAGEGKHALRFATTKRLPTYLLAFLVGDFQCISGSSGKVPIRVCSVPGLQQLGAFALDAAKASLQYFESYYAIPYPFGKLDMIAIPDFAAGAMENAGAIAYREVDLLLDEKSSSEAVEKRVAIVVMHEIAHMWFGDLVTMKWWDDLWLNEGFAALMESRGVNAWKPELKIPLDQVSLTNSAMGVDSQRSTRPIRSEASWDSAITYDKTASVLRMVEAWMGEEAFRDSIRAYLRQYAWGNAAAEDFWSSMKASSALPVDAVLQSFIDQPGPPLLHVTTDCVGGRSRVTVRQERMRFSGTESAALTWSVPVCSRLPGKDPTCQVISGAEQSLNTEPPCGAPLLLNAGGSGYYAVDYPVEQRFAIRRSLRQLTPEELVAYHGNEWLLVKNVRRDSGEYLRLLLAMPRAANHALVKEISDALLLLRNRLVNESNRAAFNAFVHNALRGYAEPSWSGPEKETSDQRATRATVLWTLGYAAEDSRVVEGARRVAAQAMRDPASVDAQIADVALRLSAVHGDAAFFDEVVKSIAAAPTPELAKRYRTLLPLFRAPELTARAIEYIASDKVRGQDRGMLMAAMYSDPVTREAAWTATKQGWGNLEKQSPWIAARVAASASSFCDSARRAEVEAFFKEHPGRGPQSRDRALETIDSCIVFRNAQQRTFDNTVMSDER